MKYPLFILATLVSATSAHAAATALNLGGNAGTAGDWSNNLPGATDGAADVGTISNDGTLPDVNFQGTVNHTGGTLTGSGGNVELNTTTTLAWNQSGGNLTFETQLSIGGGVNYTLSGGTILADPNGGGRVNALTGGTFIQSGGIIDGALNAIGGDINLTGGSAVNFGTKLTVGYWSESGAGDYFISGDHSTTFGTLGAGRLVRFDGASTTTLNFASDWAGTWTKDNLTAAQWETELTDTGILVDGVQVTSANFSTLFEVSNDGAAGSSISLIAVPEPSSTALLGLGGLALILRRRK